MYHVWSVRPQTQWPGPVRSRRGGGRHHGLSPGQHETGAGVPGLGPGEGGHSRFGDADVVRRALEAQAAEAAPDVIAGLGLRAVVGAQRTLVQVWGVGERRVKSGVPRPGAGVHTTLAHAAGPGLRAARPNGKHTAPRPPYATRTRPGAEDPALKTIICVS